MMNTSKAARNFYRISLKLTKDLERAAAAQANKHTSNANLTKALISQTLWENYNVEGDTVYHVRTLVRSSFGRCRSSPSSDAPVAVAAKGDDDSANTTKKKIEEALQGIRRLESLLMDIQSAPTGMTSKGIDDSWTAAMVDQVEWLPCMTDDDDDEKNDNFHFTTSESSYKNEIELPMIPLTQPFFALNESFHLFTRFAPWEFPMPGQEIELHIREPRYLDLYTKSFSTFAPKLSYQTVLRGYNSNHNGNHGSTMSIHQTMTAGFSTAATPYTRHFVVPFSHPHQAGTFATHGLLMEVVDWRSTRGPAGLVLMCQHVVAPQIVRIHRVVNPTDFGDPDAHLRVQVTLLDSPFADDYYNNSNNNNNNNTEETRVNKLGTTDCEAIKNALKQAVEAKFASQCQDSLVKDGVWAFLEKFQSFLQQSIQQLELHLGHRVLLAVREKRKQDNHDASASTTTATQPPALAQETLAEIVDIVHKPFRYRLLKLKLALSTSIPRVLQAKSDAELRDVLLDLIASLH